MMKRIAILSFASILLAVSCLKIEPVPLEERLPMFNWRLGNIVKVSGDQSGVSFLAVIKGDQNYLSYNYQYAGKDLIFSERNLFLYEDANAGEQAQMLAYGSWSLDNGLLHLGESLNDSLNKLIVLPVSVNDYEALSYNGSLYVGAKYFHTILNQDVYFYMIWDPYEIEEN